MARDDQTEKLDAVVTAAQDLRDNWLEGAMAQAHYRDRLVERMEAAGLLPRAG